MQIWYATQNVHLARDAFNLMATGNYAKAEVVKIVTDAELRTRTGKKLPPQTFEMMFTKAVYFRYATAAFLERSVKSVHGPMVIQTSL